MGSDELKAAVVAHIRAALEKSPNPERVGITLTREGWAYVIDCIEKPLILHMEVRGNVEDLIGALRHERRRR